MVVIEEMNIISYLSSWVYESKSDEDVVKKKFVEKVVPEIEKFKTNKNYKIVVDQLNRTHTKQKSIELMEDIKNEILLTPKKSYVIIYENRNRFVVPRIPSKLDFAAIRRINTINFKKHQSPLLIHKPFKNIYHQPRSTNQFKT